MAVIQSVELKGNLRTQEHRFTGDRYVASKDLGRGYEVS